MTYWKYLGGSVATEATSLFTSVKGLPLPAFTAPSPPPFRYRHLWDDLRLELPTFSLSAAFDSYITQSPHGGDHWAVKTFWQVFREGEWQASLVGTFPFLVSPAPVPQGDPIRAVYLWGNTGKFPFQGSQ